MHKLYSIMFFSSPLILGAIVAYAKLDVAVDWVNSFNGWIGRQLEGIGPESSFFKKWCHRPTLSVLSHAMNLSDDVQDVYMKSGIRVAACLYIIAVATYIAVSIIVTIIILVICLLILSVILSGGKLPSSDGNGGERVDNIVRPPAPVEKVHPKPQKEYPSYSYEYSKTYTDIAGIGAIISAALPGPDVSTWVDRCAIIDDNTGNEVAVGHGRSKDEARRDAESRL